MLGFSVLLTACAPANAPSEPTGSTDADIGSGVLMEDAVRMGVIMPLTGDAASIGQDVKDALTIFNAAHSRVAGKTFEILFEDGKCNGQEAASAAQKLINVDQVSYLMGGCSGETLAAAPIAERNKVLLITGVSTSPEVTTAGDYIFRSAPSDAKSTVVMAELLKDQYTKVAMITQNNDYSAAYRAGLQKTLPEAGLEIVVDEAFNSGTTDFKTILQKVKDSGADVLINVPGEIAPGGFITKQAREMGIDLPIYGGDVLNGSEYFEVAKDAAEGTRIVITAADEERQDVKDFVEQFTTETGRAPSGLVFSLATLDAMQALLNAFDAVGTDPTDVKDYLYEMPAFEGYTGSIAFDENGDSSVNPGVMIARDGKFVMEK